MSETLVHLVQLVLQALADFQGTWAYQGSLGLLVQLDREETRVNKVNQDKQVPKAHLGILV